MSVYHVHPATVVMDSCELSCGCWEPNPSPLQEEQAVLTTEANSPAPIVLFIVVI